MNLTKQILIAVVFFFSLVFNSCKNDLKLNAPYKEVPSIYAVLNPQDKIQIIRINKVFLGVGDANQMAKVADSVNYQAGDLTVTLTRFVNGNQVDASPSKKVLTFRDSLLSTDAGAFSTTQRVYVLSDPLSNFDPYDGKVRPFGDYVLTVKNNRTGNVFTARASAIDSVSGKQNGIPLTPPYYPYAPGTSPGEYIDYSAQNTTSNIYYRPVTYYTADPTKDPQIYQMIIRFHFYDILYNGARISHYVDYTLGNQDPTKDIRSVQGYPTLAVSFRGKDVFGALGIGLSRMNLSNDIQGRKMDRIQYFVYASTQDYVDYLQFAAPSLNISQGKPLYSNFDNRAALGIFTFRSRCSLYKEMSTAFISEFSSNANTCQYKFYTSAGNISGCQ